MTMSREKQKYFRTEATETSENISWNMKNGGLSSRSGLNKKRANIKRLDFYPKDNGELLKNFTKKIHMTELCLESTMAMEYSD